MRGREVIRREVEQALAGVDALLLPSLSIEAPPIGASTVPVKGGAEPVRNAMLRLTQPFNLSGHPALSLPCGLTRSRLPVGLQVVGHMRRTPDLLGVGAAIERALASR
jgi:aspartyl-tRNA(Asn)/glutamyl-tRNA(Gln) amidotransferase subunit A